MWNLRSIGSSICNRTGDILSAVFAAITQGILVAGLSNYVNQIIKQIGKEERGRVIVFLPFAPAQERRRKMKMVKRWT